MINAKPAKIVNGKAVKAKAAPKAVKKAPIAQKTGKTGARTAVKAKPAAPAPAPKKLAQPKPAVKKAAKSGPKPLATAKMDALGIEGLCAAIVDGKTLTSIAKTTGVSIGTLIAWVASDPERSVRAREARIQAAKGWDELALDGINNAKNPFELAKARDAAHHLRWRSSKISPEYSDKLGVSGVEDAPAIKFETAMPDAELAVRLASILHKKAD